MRPWFSPWPTCAVTDAFVLCRRTLCESLLVILMEAEPMAADACLDSLTSQIDAALTFVCLAEHNGRSGGDIKQAVELIERAILAHKAVVQGLDSLPATLEKEKAELNYRAETLLKAIRTVEGQFQILLDGRSSSTTMNSAGP